ncbi:cytochrome aa3 quinol oxidase subunit II [Gorillibacterium sp. CAU 1737]|uniref:cytochrome aa3 quinol oxidase subunit II n=1 Tax=Gorillibacterium sp. CAU 1737 TaxID=3140362 RepID=UPI00326139DA
MKKRGPLFVMFVALATLLTGCGSSFVVLDPKGPQAKTLSDTIIFSILMMVGILVVVYILYAYMLVKYRAKKSSDDYIPPHDEGNKWLEFIWTAIPVVIVIILSVVTVRSTKAVENVPVGYENQKPLVVYASSSNWKWHFSYPEEGVETVNYVNIPTNRPIEFRLYSFGPITSFWVPQLAGQKYAMSDMITKINLVAEVPGSYMGKNSNFSGEGFAHMEFEVQAMSQKEFDEWASKVKANEPELTETKFQELLKTAHVGRMSFSTTHLTFSPPPEGANAGHQHDSGGNEEHKNLHPSPAPSDRTEFDGSPDVSPTPTPESLSPSPSHAHTP